MKTELYTNKSTSACIKAAYTLLISTFKTTIKRLWLPALVNAALLTLLFLLYIPDKTFNEVGLSHPMITLLLITGCYILTVAANIWFMAAIASLLNGKKLNQNILRAIVVVGVGFIITGIGTFIINFGSSFFGSLVSSSHIASPEKSAAAGYIASVIILLLLYIFTLPLTFSSIRCQIDHRTKLTEIFRKGYRMGLRHWGFLFVTHLVATLLTFVACFIAFIPLLITILSQTINQLGMLNGDPSGVPGYFIYLLVATSLITMYILCFIGVWMFFISYYIYGSVEVKERAAKMAKPFAKSPDGKLKTHG